MNKLLIFVLVILVFDIAVHIRIRSCNVKPIIQQVLYTSDKYTVICPEGTKDMIEIFLREQDNSKYKLEVCKNAANCQSVYINK